MIRFSTIVRITMISLSLVFLLMACIVGEPVGSATYFINNQSDVDLYYVFPIPHVRLTPDTTKIILSKSSHEIFQDGIIGVNPVPSMSFEFIWLYASLKDSIKLVYNLHPVIDEEWIIIEQKLGKSGYGSTVYELLIENSDLKLN